MPERSLETGIVLVVDETYYEFCGETTAGLLDEYENLVVIRSFSKWAGIAGLRIGYAIGSELIVDHLMTIKQPYNLNIAAESAGLAALQHKDKLLERVSIRLTSERKRIESVIDELEGISYSPSAANFLLLKFKRLSGDEAYELLARRGIFARKFSGRRLGEFDTCQRGNAATERFGYSGVAGNRLTLLVACENGDRGGSTFDNWGLRCFDE